MGTQDPLAASTPSSTAGAESKCAQGPLLLVCFYRGCDEQGGRSATKRKKARCRNALQAWHQLDNIRRTMNIHFRATGADGRSPCPPAPHALVSCPKSSLKTLCSRRAVLRAGHLRGKVLYEHVDGVLPDSVTPAFVAALAAIDQRTAELSGETVPEEDEIYLEAFRHLNHLYVSRRGRRSSMIGACRGRKATNRPEHSATCRVLAGYHADLVTRSCRALSVVLPFLLCLCPSPSLSSCICPHPSFSICVYLCIWYMYMYLGPSLSLSPPIDLRHQYLLCHRILAVPSVLQRNVLLCSPRGGHHFPETRVFR